MKEIVFKNLDEKIYHEKILNKIDLYLYPTKKTQNFYITFNFKYGAKVLSYYLENSKTKNKIIPGSAHFLEHKIMDANYHKKEFDIINNLGSFSNAYTTYNGTNYNIFGSEDITTNLKILFDLVLNPRINEKSVESEKKIISEEIDSYKDDIIEFMYEKIKYNLFFKDYPKNSVLGGKDDISKINYKSLLKIYKDFYNLNNSFIVVTGNFNKNEVAEYIQNYFSNIKRIPKFKAKISKVNEKNDIKVSYEEVKKQIQGSRVFFAYKIAKKSLPKIKNIELRNYLNIIMSSKLSTTSTLYEKYKNEKIIVNLSYTISNFDKYYVIIIESLTNNPNEFINNLKEDISKYKIDSETFERKKKVIINNLIMTFENIEDVENLITTQIFNYNKIYNDAYNMLKNSSYKKIKSIENLLKFDKYSIIKTIK